MSFAADKVVVVPFVSQKTVAGSNGQFIDNNNGTESGADVYTDQNGNIGIGTSTPSARLQVTGEARTTDNDGNIRLYGQGRFPKTELLWTYDESIGFGYAVSEMRST